MPSNASTFPDVIILLYADLLYRFATRSNAQRYLFFLHGQRLLPEKSLLNARSPRRRPCAAALPLFPQGFCGAVRPARFCRPLQKSGRLVRISTGGVVFLTSRPDLLSFCFSRSPLLHSLPRGGKRLSALPAVPPRRALRAASGPARTLRGRGAFAGKARKSRPHRTACSPAGRRLCGRLRCRLSICRARIRGRAS